MILGFGKLLGDLLFILPILVNTFPFPLQYVLYLFTVSFTNNLYVDNNSNLKVNFGYGQTPHCVILRGVGFRGVLANFGFSENIIF